MQNFVYIIAISSLVGNATATGSVLMAENGIVITDNPITLLCETIFFLGLALIIMVKLLDKVIRGRENRRYVGEKKVKRQNRKSKQATEARPRDRVG